MPRPEAVISIETLFELAMKLSPSERVQLAERLLVSLAVAQPALGPMWDEEIDRRVAELDSGATKLIAADEVFAQARRLICG